jgi:hypothetical protein
MLTNRCQHNEARREGDRAVATIGTRRPNILLLGTTSYVWLRGSTEGDQSAIGGSFTLTDASGKTAALFEPGERHRLPSAPLGPIQLPNA